jgi:hypothetical protein
MSYMLIRFVMASVWIASAYKWSDWRNWRKYYPTLLFFGMGDLIYVAVFQKTPLWILDTKILAPGINEIFVIFSIFFPGALIFLSNFPRNLNKQIVYILLWISLYIFIELFTTTIGMQKNYRGWNIWWSLLFNFVMFPLLILHHKNPILAWTASFTFLVIVMKIFNVPFTVSK